MNKTQKNAFKWLLTQGYKESEILFKENKSPTFITPDKSYEIKRLTGTQIIFYQSQYEKLIDKKNVTILIFKDDSTSPVLTIKFDEIKSKPPKYKNLDINWVNNDKKTKTLKVSEKTKLRLQKHGYMGESFEDLINRILDKIEKK